MPYPKMGRTKQVSLRLRPEDYARLVSAARERRLTQTQLLEELVHGLPEAPAEEVEEIETSPK